MNAKKKKFLIKYVKRLSLCILCIMLLFTSHTKIAFAGNNLYETTVTLTHDHGNQTTSNCYYHHKCPGGGTASSDGWEYDCDYTCGTCGYKEACDGVRKGTWVPCGRWYHDLKCSQAGIQIGQINFTVSNSAVATVSVTGSSISSVSYAWNTGATTNTLRLTTPGTYSCTVTYVDSLSGLANTRTFSYTLVDYQVAFDANKPSITEANVAGTMASMTGLLFGTDYTLTANNFSLTGWDYSGWNTAANGTGTAYADGATINSIGVTTMYAQWTQSTYSIDYDYNVPGNTSSTVTHTTCPSTALYDTDITISNPTLLGYTFTGWEITGMDSAEHTYDGGKSTDTSASGVMGTTFRNLHSGKGTVTLTATWRPNQYTVHYNKNVPALANAQGNTGTGNMDDSTYTYDVTGHLTCNDFSITGWNFTGWNTAPDGSGTGYANESEVFNLFSDDGSEMTLYAQWTANTYPNRLFVRYQNSDGNYTEYESVPYKVNGVDADANSNVGHDSVITWSFASTSHHQANSITWVVNSAKDEYVTVMRQLYSIAVANGLHCNSIDYTVLAGAETDTSHCYYAGSNIEITSGYVDGHFQDYTGTNTQNTQTFTIEDITQDYTYTANGVDHTFCSDDVVYLGTAVNIGTINMDGKNDYSLVNYNNQRCWAYYCPTCDRRLQHGTILDETVLGTN